MEASLQLVDAIAEVVRLETVCQQSPDRFGLTDVVLVLVALEVGSEIVGDSGRHRLHAAYDSILS